MQMHLSKLEREKRPEPFKVTLSDNTTEVTFVDPKRMHFATLVEMGKLEPLDQIAAITGDGYEALKNDPEFDMEALRQIMEAWNEHYGMTDPGEASSSQS